MNRLGIFICILSCVSGVCATEHAPLQSPGFLERVQHTYGEQGRLRVEGWLEALDGWGERGKELDYVLAGTNAFFNQVRWVDDLLHWGLQDYWATPVETLGSNGGDCEDFAIGKYFTLLLLNVNPEQLRITYVKSKTYNRAHMVLAFYPSPEAEPLILDNINKTVMPASLRPDLVPVYSFNGKSIWVAKLRSEKLSADSLKSLPKWRDLNTRMYKMRKNRVSLQ